MDKEHKKGDLSEIHKSSEKVDVVPHLISDEAKRKKRRNKDRRIMVLSTEIPEGLDNPPPSAVTLDIVKSSFIAEGLSPKEIAERFYVPVELVNAIISENKLVKLRNLHIKQGLRQIQNKQLTQANEIMKLEEEFKTMKILMLKAKMEDCVAYLNRHGDFYKRHPATGEILYNTDGIPMQIRVPDASKEIKDIKNSIILSDGLNKVLEKLKSLLEIEEKLPKKALPTPSIEGLFEVEEKQEEDTE